MTITKIKDVESIGAPLYDMRMILNETGEYNIVKFSVITMPPHKRIPETGFSCHEEDEYSFFIEGSLYTESGDVKCDTEPGDITLIPKGEKHWCENRTDKPCTLVCVMVK